MVRRPGCVFCGSTTNKSSKEHLFGAKLANVLPREGLPMVGRIDFTPGGDDLRETPVPASPWEQKVSGVCRDCNSSWMNRIDEAAFPVIEPLMTGRSAVIRVADAIAFGAWATKVALMRSWMNRSRGWEADPRVFHRFQEQRLPPESAVIRAGLVDDSMNEGGSNSVFAFSHGEDLDVTLANHAQPRMNVISWSLGALFVHMILASPDMPRGQVVDISLATAEAAGPTLARVWPPRRTDTSLRLVPWDVRRHVVSAAHLRTGSPAVVRTPLGNVEPLTALYAMGPENLVDRPVPPQRQ